MPFLVPVRVLLAAFLASVSPGSAAPPAAPACPAVDVPVPVRNAPRVRAFVDPVTGRLREPTADELRRVAEERLAARPPSSRVFVVVEHPDGMKSVDLGDAFLFDVKVETREDGTSRLVCVPPSAAPANPAP